jgi:phosphoribosylanthranilate isomerase
MSLRTRIKICGVAQEADIEAADDAVDHRDFVLGAGRGGRYLFV